MQLRRWLRHWFITPQAVRRAFPEDALGRIGKAMVPRAHGLGLKVVAYDPYPDREFAAKNNVTLLPLEELWGAADIISLHTPCTAENVNLINRQTLAKMKPNSVLINTSRGGLVDEEALHEALTKGKLFGAGLDVLKIEPPIKDHPLLKLKNITIAPHMVVWPFIALAMALFGFNVLGDALRDVLDPRMRGSR